MIIGQLAALGGSCCWASCSTLFALSTRRMDIYALNLVRLFFAFCFLVTAYWIWRGSPVPLDATAEAWLWLALSSVIGFVIGDLFYFGALASIGPRITMLLFILAPPVAAVGDYLVYGSTLSVMAVAGMTVALGGVSLVITDRKEKSAGPFVLSWKGVMLGVLGSVCQGVGIVLSKMGLDAGEADLDALAGTLIRVATAVPLAAAIFFGMGKRLAPVLKERTGLTLALAGAFFGPFIGVTLSLVAVKYTHSGVAMTILSTTPITVLPFSVLVFKERLTWRAVTGAVVAVSGVLLLFVEK